MKNKNNVRIENRKAKFEYEVLDTYEAGIQLQGTEIKSIRAGHAGVADAYCYVQEGEVFVKGMRIDHLKNAEENHEPMRVRKLLLKKAEINKLSEKMVKGQTLVVLALYVNDRGLAKMKIALGKGKNQKDKRNTIKDRDAARELHRINKLVGR